MNKAMLTVGIILLAVMSLLLINVLNNYETGGELDYYLVKETTEAAMQDAIDVEYYRQNSLIRMDKEKFVENFVKRFANSVDATRDYKIGFYDINEAPPKVSVKVDSMTTFSFKSNDDAGKEKNEAANITTSYDAIVESNYKSDVITEINMKDPDADQCKNLYK